ncbi:MAG TPA: putative baseplate assembly protein [Gemmatimonadaceae bacterium]|nr:putative baseplate assembly protein [Gemmatimonadaceae bacterium]
MSTTSGGCACGCCAGTRVETPVRVHNAHGLNAIAYRVGRHGTFLQSMLARLSSAGLPSLAALRTRDRDDFSIALLDAASTMLDVLTFYQERLANEHYLRTATERRSIGELARLIGYQLGPGVAATTRLAFTVQEPAIASTEPARPITLTVGSSVQSVPGPEEKPQTFETVEEIEVRAEWNAIPVQRGVPWIPAINDFDAYVAGVSVSPQVGDVVLIVGRERELSPLSENWDVRVISAIEMDPERDRTRIRWTESLGSPRKDESGQVVDAGNTKTPSSKEPRLFVFRQRAALFGHNAPDSEAPALGARIDLDAAYPKVVKGSWLALASEEIGPRVRTNVAFPGYVELYRADAVSFPSRAGYKLSGRVTRIYPDTTGKLSQYKPRDTLVLGQSEELPVLDRPLASPLFGGQIVFGRRVDGLRGGRALAVSGKRQRVRVARHAVGQHLVLDDGTSQSIEPGESFIVCAAPENRYGSRTEPSAPEDFEHPNPTIPRAMRFHVLHHDGREGHIDGLLGRQIELAPALKSDSVMSEVVSIEDSATAVTDETTHTSVRLAARLRHAYDRWTVRVNANVALATHGETVSELLGSGDARTPDQRFVLKQSPLTYVSAETPTGRASTLRVTVNGLEWHEVPMLYGAEPNAHVFDTTIADNGSAMVRFGDGVEGARLPTGQGNVRATYRKFTGAEGNVGPAKLTTLLKYPVGLSAAVNPEPAAGGEDEEQPGDARANAPLTVLTLDRAVSIRDYEDFARAFGGIAKAHAVWIVSGAARGVFVTVAGVDGAAVANPGQLHDALLGALRRYGTPFTPVRVESYVKRPVAITAQVNVADDADPATVLAAARQCMLDRYGFAAREFGQGVSVDQIAATIHSVASVVAVNVERLQIAGSASTFHARLAAKVPSAQSTGVPSAAELLVLEPVNLELRVMS